MINSKLPSFAFLAFGLLLGSCSASTPASRKANYQVKRGDLSYQLTLHGEIQATSSLELHAPVVTALPYLTIESVLPDGTAVKAGDVVLSFSKDALNDKLRAVQADLAIAQAELRREQNRLNKEQAGLELQVRIKKNALEKSSLKTLAGKDLQARIDYDRSLIEVKNARLELDAAQHAWNKFSEKKTTDLHVTEIKVEENQKKVSALEGEIASLDMKAPAAGIVFAPFTQLNGQRGKVVRGKVVVPGDKVMELPDLSQLYAQFYVREQEFRFIEVGDKVQLFPTVLQGQEIQGEVTKRHDFSISRNERVGYQTPGGSIKEQMIEVKLAATNPLLRSGNTVRLELKKNLATQVLMVPLAYVNLEGDHFQVKRENGKKSTVVLGHTSFSEAEIVSGLEENAVVVTN
jgi:HlyD family secretion protein